MSILLTSYNIRNFISFSEDDEALQPEDPVGFGWENARLFAFFWLIQLEQYSQHHIIVILQTRILETNRMKGNEDDSLEEKLQKGRVYLGQGKHKNPKGNYERLLEMQKKDYRDDALVVAFTLLLIIEALVKYNRAL